MSEEIRNGTAFQLFGGFNQALRQLILHAHGDMLGPFAVWRGRGQVRVAEQGLAGVLPPHLQFAALESAYASCDLPR